jgi:hypothetical protein
MVLENLNFYEENFICEKKNNFIYDDEVDEKNLLDEKFFQLTKKNESLITMLNKDKIKEMEEMLKTIKFSTKELDINPNDKLNIYKYPNYVSNLFDETKVKF